MTEEEAKCFKRALRRPEKGVYSFNSLSILLFDIEYTQ